MCYSFSSTIYARTTSHLPAFGFFLYCMIGRASLSTVHFNQTILIYNFIQFYRHTFLCSLFTGGSNVLYLANSDLASIKQSDCYLSPNLLSHNKSGACDLYPVRWFNIIYNQRLSWLLCYGAAVYFSFSGNSWSEGWWWNKNRKLRKTHKISHIDRSDMI